MCAGWIDVAWDAGGTNSYRMGAEGKYDLMLAPSHNTEKTRKDLLSPRSLNKAKGLSADGADGKNKVLPCFALSSAFLTWRVVFSMSCPALFSSVICCSWYSVSRYTSFSLFLVFRYSQFLMMSFDFILSVEENS